MLGKSPSNRSTPATPETTKIHATPEGLDPSKLQKADQDRQEEEQKDIDDNKNSKLYQKLVSDKENPEAANPGNPDTKVDADDTATATKPKNDHVKTESISTASWRGWFAKDGLRDNQSTVSVPDNMGEAPSTPQLSQGQPAAVQELRESTNEKPSVSSGTQEMPMPDPKRGWLQIWGNDSSARPSSAPPDRRTALSTDTPQKSNITDAEQPQHFTNVNSTMSEAKGNSSEASAPPQLGNDGSKSSAWVFWSRERTTGGSGQSTSGVTEGELAVSNTPSQQKPRRASLSVPETNTKKSPEPKTSVDPQARNSSPASSTRSKNKPQQPFRKDDGSESKSSSGKVQAESNNAKATTKPPEKAQSAQLLSMISRKRMDNLLLPSFKDTFILQQSPSILEQIRRLLYFTSSPEPNHLGLIREPTRIKRALAIGVHGYFPAPLVRTVLGQPTGTSIKFAEMAANSIQKWARDHDCECEVKTAALEGEGRITERVDLLWKLLLNWIDEIRKADFIMVACHSQGVPVAIMLVAKLIHFGCINSARVSICAMAGVNMGPFQDYKSRWISGSAGELFEFTDPLSRVSTDYLASLETVLKFGVHVSFIGSIDDQLVSLESALFSPVSHPHIYRAVLIDSRIHAPNFLSHLVGFALKLRNLGVPDHGLIRELSPPLAGSLYSGEGHSRIYEDETVYDLAIAFALETSSLNNAPITQRPTAVSSSNPYILPFAMRGILEEEYVKNDLQSEVSQLLKEFDDWKPATRVLKDVKFRLEGIRSKL